MKALIVENTAKVYKTTDAATWDEEFPIGAEIILGAVSKKNGKQWVAVSLPNGTTGFIQGDTPIFAIKEAMLVQNEVDVYSEPSPQSPLKTQYKKNDHFELMESINKDGKTWVRVRDNLGNEGFIDGETKIKVVEAPEVSASNGIGNMIVGGLFCIGGTIATMVSYDSATTSGGGHLLCLLGRDCFWRLAVSQGPI